MIVRNAIRKFDFIYISETYPDKSISSNDGNLSVPKYTLTRLGHFGNAKRGGI